MTAAVEATGQGTWRAVCRDETCRAATGQRAYWRTGHLYQTPAAVAAADHNQTRHQASSR